jgi:hypothetical protein
MTNFKPFKIEIEINDEFVLREMWHRLNFSNQTIAEMSEEIGHKRLDMYKGYPYLDCKEGTQAWNELSEKAKDFDLFNNEDNND